MRLFTVFSLFQDWYGSTMADFGVRRRSFGQLAEMVGTQMPLRLRDSLIDCTYEKCKLASRSLDADWVLYFDRHTS